MLTPAIPSLPSRIDAVVIGVSAGAVEALGQVLPLLPAETPWPVVIVVHIPANQPSLLSTLFTRRCAAPVRDPEDKQPITPGIWFAPPGYHLLVESNGVFSLSIEAPVNHSRPSIDVLFESAADAYTTSLIGLVLTGANRDGARGARAIREAGGFVIVQDPATAEVSTMPSEAIAEGRPQWVATLPEIGKALRDAALAGAP